MLIEVKHIPFMDAEPSLMMQKLRVEHIMQRRRLIMLRRHITVGEVVALLSDPDVCHNAFPVVKGSEHDLMNVAEEHSDISKNERRIVGLVLRAHLKFFIKHKLFLCDSETQMFSSFQMASENTSYEEHCGDLPIELDEQYYDYLIDLSRFMSRSPPTISPCATVARSFHMFRSLGLRHLVVTNASSQVVGMITRHDLVDVQIHPHKYAHAANFKYFKQMELVHKRSGVSVAGGAHRDRINSMVYAPTQAGAKSLLPVDDTEAPQTAGSSGSDSDDSEEWDPQSQYIQHENKTAIMNLLRRYSHGTYEMFCFERSKYNFIA
jgi:CBS domain-containing protein